MKARIIVLAASVAAATAADAATWKGLSDENHYSGPKVSESALAGKVVLVDRWGVACPPCRAMLPRMEQIWKSFRHKPFVLVGSHCQGRQPEKVKALVKKNGLTYPVYEGFKLEGEPSFDAIPFVYVVDHRGKIVYSGHDDRAATEAVVNALGKIGAPPPLFGDDVSFKEYKGLDKQLVFGKNVKSVLSKLEADVKRGQSKFAKDSERAKAGEAEAILAAVSAAKAEIKSEIDGMMESNPAEALKLVKGLIATFPEERAAYSAGMSDLQKKARAFEAEQKALARQKEAAAKAAARKR